ncbi:hypothetical protein BDK51DRAFT_47038 [Blyttiomyces helicus]|uniref:Uncharacterized protein n=1 Tax=Blyttiomyces helicus TaxID=388810 RepID=A0A4V1IQF5_9FUNG|nr:hypothetical protein BDK51DRAFT_47038 [Blyttiomyces helicus]|eukprot:RKO86377.1 hypothetical protein BDK51DRAFT_47038 [Blyttiomyces helicus]
MIRTIPHRTRSRRRREQPRERPRTKSQGSKYPRVHFCPLEAAILSDSRTGKGGAEEGSGDFQSIAEVFSPESVRRRGLCSKEEEAFEQPAGVWLSTQFGPAHFEVYKFTNLGPTRLSLRSRKKHIRKRSVPENSHSEHLRGHSILPRRIKVDVVASSGIREGNAKDRSCYYRAIAEILRPERMGGGGFVLQEGEMVEQFTRGWMGWE